MLNGSNINLKIFLSVHDAMYAAVTAKGLAKKGTLIGLSRGGLYAFNWASHNPGRAACIYGDAPVCDFKSWPAGKGKGKGTNKLKTAALKPKGGVAKGEVDLQIRNGATHELIYNYTESEREYYYFVKSN